MMNFLEYTILSESDLEDMEFTDYAPDDIELLHEIEYKMGKIIDRGGSINDKLYVNLIKRFAKLAKEVYESLSEKFDDTITNWLEDHQIDDPTAWAERVYEGMVEQGTPSIASWGPVNMTKEDVISSVDTDDIISFIEYSYGNITDYGEHLAGDFLNSWDIPTPEDEDDDFWEENNIQAIDYIVDHNMERRFAEYIVEYETDEGTLTDMEFTEDLWIAGIEAHLFPEYYDLLGPAIEEVRDPAIKAVERIRLTDDAVTDIDSLCSILDPVDAKGSKAVSRIYKIIGRAATAISLSMQVMHVSGSIIQDRGEAFGLEDVDITYLDYMNDRNVADWNEELGKVKVHV